MIHFLKKYFSYIVLIFILSSYFFFGIQHLGKFITADEHYWVQERIPQYWNAIADKKWKKTFINDKPGVSLALVSGIGYFLHSNSPTLCTENDTKILTCETDQIKNVYKDFRLPILIVNGFLLVLFFFLIVKLTNPWVALWAITLTVLSPILLGISQIVNPDSLLWSFGMIAIFSFFNLLKSNEKKFLWLTIIFSGLALLSKYTALILFPFYLAMIILQFLYDDKATIETLRATIKTSLIQWIFIVFGSLIILCLFLPALLLSPKALETFLFIFANKSMLFLSGGVLLSLLIVDTVLLQNKILFYIRSFCQRFLAPLAGVVSLLFFSIFLFIIIARNFFTEWTIFTLIPFDIKDLSDSRYYRDVPHFFEAFILEWNPLVFSLTPIVLFGLGALVFFLLKKKRNVYSLLVYSLLSFIFAYNILLILSNVLAVPRYSVLLYPLFSFLSALGFWFIYERFTLKWVPTLITIIIFTGSIMSIDTIKPFYFNYANFFLPQDALISDSWGYGGYEAAEYLNGLPDAKNLTIWSDYYGVCEFFVGKCLTAYTFDASAIHPDYYVLTRRGEARFMPRYDRWEEKSGLIAYKYYDTVNPAWQLNIDNHLGNFVKVVKITQ